MQQADSNRIPLYEDKDLSFELEYNGEWAILHTPRIENFSKTMFKEKLPALLDGWTKFFNDFGLNALFTAVIDGDDKAKKITEKIGFTYIGTHDNLHVYQWIPKENE